jgi:NADH-quinone oxidoreductase subunit M
MGFVLLGVYAWNQYALQGAVMVMLAHGISTGALFVTAGALQDRMHTREMPRMGGLWDTIPRMGGTSLLFAAASLGLPGLGNFVGEILVLVGVFQANVTMAVLATLGFIVSTIYSLWMIQRTFQGPNQNGWSLPDLDAREALIMASLIAAILWLGVYPRPVLNTAQPALQTLQQITNSQTKTQHNSPPGTAAAPGAGSLPLTIHQQAQKEKGP